MVRNLGVVTKAKDPEQLQIPEQKEPLSLGQRFKLLFKEPDESVKEFERELFHAAEFFDP
eukprot:CAMPEP_0197007678 /NCGR_PEP_ID=MMETSP1380-20130617/41789_1 /TAXON_ID=5936 /ORGANISM="Euplotes crassus, Strain CT5" /LENGTH=59 /DNA_ID=CAMNT_0042427903 /DNA_START=54 /DNA_END=233 /DNA_ORIENTATION=+